MHETWIQQSTSGLCRDCIRVWVIHATSKQLTESRRTQDTISKPNSLWRWLSYQQWVTPNYPASEPQFLHSCLELWGHVPPASTRVRRDRTQIALLRNHMDHSSPYYRNMYPQHTLMGKYRKEMGKENSMHVVSTQTGISSNRTVAMEKYRTIHRKKYIALECIFYSHRLNFRPLNLT